MPVVPGLSGADLGVQQGGRGGGGSVEDFNFKDEDALDPCRGSGASLRNLASPSHTHFSKISQPLL